MKDGGCRRWRLDRHRQGRGVRFLLVVLALFLADARFVQAQTAAPSDETRRNVDTAVVFALAADHLCGTAYLKTVIANGRRDGVTLDDIMRRDKPQIDDRANNLIAQNDSEERKEKFCEKIRRDAASAPEE